MARKQRIHFPGAVYHVMQRGNGAGTIFFSDQDRCRFFLLLQEATARFHCRVHAFCMMENHFHLAIQVGTVPLSKIMQNVSFRYTSWVNKNQGRIGHLFQGRYKAILVEKKSYLLELVRYIHLNPVRAGLAANPEDYLWCGHRTYVGDEAIPWLTTDWILGQLGDDLDVARARYVRFVLDGVGQELEEGFRYGSSIDSRAYGTDSFVEQALEQGTESENRPPEFVGIVEAVCRSYDSSATRLKLKGQGRIESQARALIGFVATSTKSATLTEVAKYFERDVATLSTGIKRLKTRIYASENETDIWRKVLEQFKLQL